MVSSGSAAVFAFARLIAANPYLWSGLVGFFFGLCLAQGLRWVLAHGLGAEKRGRKPRRLQARHSVLAVTSMAFVVLSGTAFLIFPEKTGLREALIIPWTVFLAVLGLVLGLWPRLGLVLMTSLILGLGGLMYDALAGWTALESPIALARLLPFSRNGESWNAEFLIFQRDSVPTAQSLEIRAESAALVIERLELKGPASLLGAKRRYRIVGLADAEGRISVAFPARLSVLERLEALPDGFPAGPRGFLVSRSREGSPSRGMSPLSPIVFSFQAGDSGRLELKVEGANPGS